MGAASRQVTAELVVLLTTPYPPPSPYLATGGARRGADPDPESVQDFDKQKGTFLTAVKLVSFGDDQFPLATTIGDHANARVDHQVPSARRAHLGLEQRVRALGRRG